MDAFTKVATANAAHFNNHPVRHIFIVFVLGLVALRMIQRLAYLAAVSMIPDRAQFWN